jgi:light-regulated signal transduction histidine kinase (bacteriophytochrome)
LRGERTRATERSARLTIWSVGVLTLLTGILLALLSRGQVRWLSSSFNASLTRASELSAHLEQRVVERTQELSLANDKLGEANQELEAFSYSVSHDLRAPMRHITGFALLLRQSLGSKISEDDRENLDTIHRTAVLAGRMVDDLLAFSRIGRTQLRRVDIDMNAVVSACVAELSRETKQRKIEWIIHDLRPSRGDPTLLKMAVLNLLGNAVKYSAPREPARIEVGSAPEQGGTTYFFRDNGVGFDMKYVHKLFGVFQRLHRAEDFEGTGIGLAHVRRIVIRHGGRVWAEGRPDEGATFYLFLPDVESIEAS